jgi:hypothetical protein
MRRPSGAPKSVVRSVTRSLIQPVVGQRRALTQCAFDGAPGKPRQRGHDQAKEEQDDGGGAAQVGLDRQGEGFQGDAGGDEGVPNMCRSSV